MDVIKILLLKKRYLPVAALKAVSWKLTWMSLATKSN